MQSNRQYLPSDARDTLDTTRVWKEKVNIHFFMQNLIINTTYVTGKIKGKIPATDISNTFFVIPADFNVMIRQGLKLTVDNFSSHLRQVQYK